MADFGSIGVDLVVSKTTSFDSPSFMIDDWTPARFSGLLYHQHRRLMAGTGAGASLALTAFTTISGMIVKNHDATNTVRAAWGTTAPGGVVAYSDIPPGGFAVASTVHPNVALTLIASNAACEVEIALFGV